jgi:hypothetical protein
MQRFKRHHAPDPYGMNAGSQDFEGKGVLNKKNLKSQNLHLKPMSHMAQLP